jgi:hypothetical protein
VLARRVLQLVVSIFSCSLLGCQTAAVKHGVVSSQWYPLRIVWSPSHELVAIEEVKVREEDGGLRFLGNRVRIVNTMDKEQKSLYFEGLMPLWLDDNNLVVTVPISRSNSDVNVSLRRVEIITGVSKEIISFPTITTAIKVISPKKLLVISGKNRSLFLLQTEIGYLKQFPNVENQFVDTVDYHPQSQKVAVFRDRPSARIDIIDLPTMKTVQSIPSPCSSIEKIYWFDHQSLIAVCAEQGNERLVYVDLISSKPKEIITASSVAHLSVASTGLCLVGISRDPSQRRWIVYDVRHGYQWAVLPDSIVGASISPDGNRLLLIHRQLDDYIFETVSPEVFR